MALSNEECLSIRDLNHSQSYTPEQKELIDEYQFVTRELADLHAEIDTRRDRIVVLETQLKTVHAECLNNDIEV